MERSEAQRNTQHASSVPHPPPSLNCFCLFVELCTATVSVGTDSALPWDWHHSGAPVSSLSQRCVKSNVELIRAGSAVNLTGGDSCTESKTAVFARLSPDCSPCCRHRVVFARFLCCWTRSPSSIFVLVFPCHVDFAKFRARSNFDGRHRANFWANRDDASPFPSNTVTRSRQQRQFLARSKTTWWRSPHIKYYQIITR